jgi:hypothetical protein
MKYPLHRSHDGRWVHTWVRQSSIKTSDMCLERWRNDIFGTVSEQIKDASMLGTVCHSVAEDACNSLIDVSAGHSEVAMGLDDMLAAFEYYWEEAVPTIKVWNSYSPDTAHDVGVEKIKAWADEIYPTVSPMHAEYTFDVPLIEDDERIVRMTGTVDLVEENRLWDWKFPGRDYTRDKWQYERWDVQSIAYCYALGIPNFSYAIMHPKGVGRMDLERDQSHFDWLREKVSALCRLLETNPTGPYPLGDNGWWCSEKWCENFARCKGATQGGA